MARGSVFKKPNGSYTYRIDIGRDPVTGLRRQQQRSGFRTKKAAVDALNKVSASLASGFDLGHSEMLIGPYLEQWLDDQRRHLKATTWASYQVAAARIIRLLGWQSLTDLTPLAIEAFYAELGRTGSRSGKPLAPKSVRNTHVVLRKALADAERLGLVQRNAAAAARPPAAPRREPTTWSAAEIRAFLDSVAEDRLLATYVLLATTGMRRGEVLGLRWSDVDLDRQQLAVIHTVTTVNYQPVISSPKTKRSRRVVYLDNLTVVSLKRTGRGE